MRYLGGGVGHLEQFPPANNDARIAYDGEAEDEDDPGAGDAEGDGRNQDNEEGEEGRGEEGEGKEDEGVEGENGEDLDPGESADEDAGNVY